MLNHGTQHQEFPLALARQEIDIPAKGLKVFSLPLSIQDGV